MRIKTIAATIGVLALSAAPAVALPAQANEHAAAHAPSAPSAPAKQGAATGGKAYGKLCAAQSHRHAAGQHGTPFSQCVSAMAKAAHGANPTSACKAVSKKHVAGEKSTAFSRCVVAAAKLKHDQADAADPAPATDTGTTAPASDAPAADATPVPVTS